MGTYFRWHNLAIALVNAGHDVDIYAGDHDVNSKIREEVWDGIHYFIVPTLRTSRIFFKPNDPFTAVRRLFHLPEKEYDVYHMFQPFLQALVPWAYLKKVKKTGIFLYDWDDLWTGGLFLKAKNIREHFVIKVTRRIEKKAPTIADGVTVCSDFLAKKISRNNPVEIIGNGFWPKERKSKKNMRTKWAFEENVFYIGYIGKTSGELDWIIEGFNNITDKGIDNVKLVIVGPHKSDVENYTIKQNAGLVNIGPVSPEDAAEIATAIDLGLIPLEDSPFNQSRFPIKFFDFLSSGTPVYMSDVGDIALLAKTIDKAIVASSTRAEWIENLSSAIHTVKTSAFGHDAELLLEPYTWQGLARKQSNFYTKIKALKSAL